MDIKVANELYDNGILLQLCKEGFLSPKMFIYREIYLWVDAQVKVRGISKSQAALEAEVKFRKGDATIWRALRSFS